MTSNPLDTSDGTVTIRLAGKLSPENLAAMHATAGGYLKEWGGGNVLILAESFEGWTRDGDWNELPFQTANDDLIRKMAIVGDIRWKDMVTLFTARGIRPFPIEYFQIGLAEDALAWLKA